MSSKSTKLKSNPLLILGWDGAEWSEIHRYCKKGWMPHFNQLLKSGSQASIASLQPMLSPLLWTSIATGKRAHDHGVLGFVENTLEGPKAISSYQRQVPAIWNILSEAGLICQVLNWWPSNPAEEILGDFISNLAFVNPDLEGQCFPEEWQEELKSHAQADHELDYQSLQAFFPSLSAEEMQHDEVVAKAAKIINRTRHQFDLALKLLDHKADCRLFYFEALDQLQHLGAPFYGDSNSPYKNLIPAAYRWHDAMLGALLNKMEGHNIILLSDHGFKLSAERPEQLPDIPAAPALEHNPYGVFVAAGPDVNTNTSINGLSLLDIAPIVLHHFHLPQGQDMHGRRQPVFNHSWPNSYLSSWNGLAPINFLKDEGHYFGDQLKDLEELEYIDLSEDNLKQGIEEEQDYNRAISLKEVGNHALALDISERWLPVSNRAYRWYVLKARLLVILREESAWELFWNKLSPKQQDDPHLQFNLALMHLQQGNPDDALAIMHKIEEKGFPSSGLYQEMGRALFLAGELEAAQNQFSKALNSSPNSASTLNGLAQIAYARGQMDDFQKFANQSLQLKMHQPQLHYLWASYYNELGDLEATEKALAICLQMAPKHQKALALKRNLEKDQPEGYSFIVSGFPRSGTSLMMALLKEAGLSIISDNQRKSDHHNPKGYFEWEGVKSLAAETKLPKTQGKVIKVVAPLLPYLPANRNYKVIWMERPTLELILSQAKMRGDQASLESFPFQKGQQLESEKQRFQNWLNAQPHVEWLSISYPDLVHSNKEELLKKLSTFIGVEISINHWQKVVEPQLHRNKIG